MTCPGEIEKGNANDYPFLVFFGISSYIGR